MPYAIRANRVGLAAGFACLCGIGHVADSFVLSAYAVKLRFGQLTEAGFEDRRRLRTGNNSENC